jgi:hypothetical protein
LQWQGQFGYTLTAKNCPNFPLFLFRVIYTRQKVLVNMLRDYQMKHPVEPLTLEEIKVFDEICEKENITFSAKVMQLIAGTKSGQNINYEELSVRWTRQANEVTKLIRNNVVLYRRCQGL